MFEFSNHIINKVFNPLKVKKNSIMEFEIGELHDTGIYRFKKIIEMHIGPKVFTRYLIYSKSENTEYVFEVFPIENEQLETYLYSLTDTIPFSEEFLEVAGQKYLTTPDGEEYERVYMPEEDDRVDGIPGKIKIYDVESDRVEKETGITVWDYQQEADGSTKFLNLEMMEDTGMFRVFRGEMLEEIFYKVLHGSE
jgi:hypothetical protein